jgi:PAS domain S-box-containing protein
MSSNVHPTNNHQNDPEFLRQRIQELEAVETEQKTIQEELRQTGLKYYSLFEYAGDAIFIIDPETLLIMDANAAAIRRFGYSEDELKQLQLGDIEVLPNDDLNDNASIWESSFGGTQFYECHYQHKNGAQTPVEVSSRLVTYGNREVFQNFVRDISKRKAAENTLQEAHDRLLVLGQVDAELTKQLDVTYVLNMALDAAVSLSLADTAAIGIAEGDFVRVVHAVGSYSKEIGAQLSIGTGICGRAFRHQQAELVTNVSRDPDYVAIIPETQAQIALPLISHNRFLGIMSLETPYPERFTPDIFDFLKLLTTRIAVALDNSIAYEQQEQLIEELDAFAHTVAHDLQNPLNIIGGYASVLNSQFDSMSHDDLKTYLDAIAQGTKKMSNIINELLLLSSVRQIDEIERTDLSMYRIISEALSRLTLLIEGHSAEIKLPSPDSFPPAIGYAPWVEEIWANYLSNAIKYGGRPPQIEVGASTKSNGRIQFWVRDNGQGISPENQAKLFREHMRLGDNVAGGHGLGLSIVKRIAQKLGGDVGVESTVGQGSTFYFTLPAAQ